MAGLEGDTSSFNQPLPVGPLDVAKNIAQTRTAVQGNISNDISIDKQKLDLINTQFGLMNQELSALSDDPNITKAQAAERLQRFSNTYKFPKEATEHMMQELNQAPSVKAFSDNALRRGMTVQEKLNQQYGTSTTQNDNKFLIPGVTAPAAKGGGFAPSGKALPIQIAPGTIGYDPTNQQVFEQPAGPAGVPMPLPRARPSLPVERPTTGATGPTVYPTTDTPTTFADRLEPLKAGPSPLFPEGKEAYTKAQLTAGTNAQAVKPAIQALKLMPGLATGPGTGQFNDLVAAAKAWGVVDTKAENDPTVLRQELTKKLAQFVGSSPIGKRSDAAQTLAEAGSPDPKKQLLPALINLTRDAVGLYRVEQLLPNAFKGNDYQNFIKHQGSFAQSVDEKALTLDLMPTSEREALVKKMVTKYKNNPNDPEANKFLNTVKLAKDAKIFDSSL